MGECIISWPSGRKYASKMRSSKLTLMEFHFVFAQSNFASEIFTKKAE